MITHLDFELSSICNAGCPVCPRRDGGTYNVFDQTYWSLNEVKRVMGGLVNDLKVFHVCGNFGDGMGNPDVVPICEWVLNENPDCYIHISTNGGIGNEDQYRRLGSMGVSITFGIDGYGKKNELYRINAKWDKVERNIRSFSSSVKDKKQVEIQFLLWDQTRDQIKKIYDFCHEITCDSLFLREPFTKGYYTKGYNMRGEYSHSLTYEPNELTKTLSSKKWGLTDLNEIHNLLSTLDLGQRDVVYETDVVAFNHNRGPYQQREPEYGEEERVRLDGINKQSCYSKNTLDPFDLSKDNFNLYITYDGLLMPCCMIPPEYSLSISTSKGDENPKQIEILNKVLGIGLDRFSLKERTIQEVFDTGVLHRFVYNDLINDTQFGFCKTVCGKCEVI